MQGLNAHELETLDAVLLQVEDCCRCFMFWD